MNIITTPQSESAEDTARQLLDLIAQCADYYWKEDARGVCHQLRSHPSFCRDVLGVRHHDRTLADAGLQPVDEDDNLTRYRQARSAREAFHNITFCLTTSGGNYYYSISGTPLLDSEGRFGGYHCAAIDISERRDTESGLKRFRIAMDMSMDMIYLVDRETLRFIDVNQTACEAVGRPREEMLQVGPAELLDIPEAELVERYDHLIQQGSSSRMEREVEFVPGTLSVIEVYSRATIIDGRWTIVGMSRDITERRRGEAQLRESEARFRSLTSLGSDFYWQQDTEFRFTEYEGRVVGDTNRRAIASMKGRHLESSRIR